MASTQPIRPSRKVSISFKNAERKTKQAFRDECDINQILRRYNATGVLPDLIKKNPQYGDFSDPTTFQDAQNVVLHAKDQFANLSATLRDRFSNDPIKFLEFTADPSNLPEMVKLGLAVQRQTNQTNDDQASNPNDQQKKENTESAPKK